MSNSNIINSGKAARSAIARFISRKLLPDSFSIISDDCWGGQLYRYSGLRYTTPTIGLWIEPKDYLVFLDNILGGALPTIKFRATSKNYPVAECLGSVVHFMHYPSESEAVQKFRVRYGRIDWDNIFVKIDFGKPGYTFKEMEIWNEMQFANSVAFYSPTTKIPECGLHNGILIDDWVLNGATMFDITRSSFDVFRWLRGGNPSKRSIFYRVINTLFLDPTILSRIKQNYCAYMP